jgi:hypothetical protein
MLSLPKLAVISLVVIVKGHRNLQCSLLPVKKVTTLLKTVATTIKKQDNGLINHPINNYKDAQSGTLYLMHEQSEQGETSQQHSLSLLL